MQGEGSIHISETDHDAHTEDVIDLRDKHLGRGALSAAVEGVNYPYDDFGMDGEPYG